MTFNRQPNDPVQFFARFLQNECKTMKVVDEDRHAALEQGRNRIAHEDRLREVKETAKVKKTEEAKVDDEKKAFFDDLEQSDDLNDKLQSLIEFLQEHTKATGIYIGNLQFPEVPIEDDAMEMDHLNQEAPKVIKFTHASEDHKYIINRTLTED